MSVRVCLLLFLLLLAASSHGTDGRTVVTPVAGQVYVPAYQASYSASDDLLKQILAEVKGLRQDVRGLQLGKPAQGLDPAAVFKQRCASCHAAGVADDKGGSFVLVEADGKPAELSLAEKRRVVRLVEQGKMPPPPEKLSEEERKVIQTLKPQEQRSKP